MRAIVRQAIANLRSRKLQAVLIFLTLWAAAALLTVALSTLQTARGAYERLFERTRGAHLWLYLDPRRVTPEQAWQVLSTLAGVEGTTEAIPTFYSPVYRGEESLSEVSFREWPGETQVGRLLLVEGRAPADGEKDVVVLDRNVAAEHQVKVGDTVDVLTPAGRHPLTVVGLVVSAEWCPYPNCSPGRAYLAPGGTADLGLSSALEQGYLSIGVRLEDPADLERVREMIEGMLPAGSIRNWTPWERSRSFADYSTRIEATFLTAFSVVAGLAAGFLVANAIGGAVRAQTRQIGLLKAAGFTGGQLVQVYLVEYLGLALLAGLAGLVLGGVGAAMVLRSVAAKFGDTAAFPPSWIVLVVILSVLLLTALFSFWPARRAVRLDVVRAIRVGAERPRRRSTRLPRLPLSLATGVGEVLAYPLRSALTALGLGMAVLTLAFALTMNATIRYFVADPTQIGATIDGDVALTRSIYLSDAEVRRLIAAQPDVAAYYAQVWDNFQLPGEEEKLSARFREGDVGAFRMPLLEGRMLERPDEALVGYGLAQERDLHPGDELTILLEGQPFTLRVAGTYREGNNMGRMLLLSTELLRQTGSSAEPTVYVLKLRPGADVEAAVETLAQAGGDQLEVSSMQSGEVPQMVQSLQWVMAGLSLVLGGLAVVGVFNSVWMGVQERRQDFGLLKAVGMTPGQVALSVFGGAAFLAVIGYAIGLPLGLWGSYRLLDALARWNGFGPLDALVDWVGALLLLPGIVLVAVLGAFIPARRAGRVGVVEVLRYE